MVRVNGCCLAGLSIGKVAISCSLLFVHSPIPSQNVGLPEMILDLSGGVFQIC